MHSLNKLFSRFLLLIATSDPIKLKASIKLSRLPSMMHRQDQPLRSAQASTTRHLSLSKHFYPEFSYFNYFYRTPGLVLEPKERGGEVTVQQFVKPCIFIDIA